jgi:hypothetical protein
MRHLAALEQPCTRRREPQDMRACTPILSFILTWSLYAGISGIQGTDSGPRAHPGRGCEPVGGPASYLVQPFYVLYIGIS